YLFSSRNEGTHKVIRLFGVKLSFRLKRLEFEQQLKLLQQTTNNKQQTTNNKQQTTNNKQQTTNNKQQTTNNKQQWYYLKQLKQENKHNGYRQ
ncbi:MAG: hypothetical protein LBT18_05280, partial [Endomicrobium sp.]|nr:hypothetical protein [Endomicrobium sp.]